MSRQGWLDGWSLQTVGFVSYDESDLVEEDCFFVEEDCFFVEEDCFFVEEDCFLLRVGYRSCATRSFSRASYASNP